MEHEEDKLSWITPAGRTQVNPNVLLREPRVRQTLQQLASHKQVFLKQRGSGVAVVRRIKSDS